MKTIPLTQGKVAIVDNCDYVAVSRFKWSFCASHGYAVRTTSIKGGQRRRTVLLHRFIAERAGKSLAGQIDHRDLNKLNCRRRNLRPATPRQNRRNRGKTRANTTGYKGVFRTRSPINPFAARLCIGNGKRVNLGYHPTAEAAALAYDKGAIQHFGEFANLNFPVTGGRFWHKRDVE